VGRAFRPCLNRSRADREKKQPECGDASACLKLRIPVTRRDQSVVLQKVCPQKIRQIVREIG
jgi:hypothetical protein